MESGWVMSDHYTPGGGEYRASCLLCSMRASFMSTAARQRYNAGGR